MSTIFERNSNQALIGKIEKLAKKYNKTFDNITQAQLKDLGFKIDLRINELNFDLNSVKINAFIDSALTSGMQGLAPSTTSTTKTTDTNKPKFYQELKDILIDSTLEDLKSIREFQKISKDELKNLENLEKTLGSFKKDVIGSNLDVIMIFRNEISEITGSLKLNITALQNFDKDEVKLANLLQDGDKKITREELAKNIKFENERLNNFGHNHKEIEKSLNANDASNIKDNIVHALKHAADLAYKNINQGPRKQNTEKILSNAKQFEKAKWNKKGVIVMLIKIFSSIFGLNKQDLKTRFAYAKLNASFVKEHDKTMKQIKECLKEYAKLSRQFENLEREYANPGVTDKTKHGENKTKFNEISTSLKQRINFISGEYKKIENIENQIKDKKQEIKALNKKSPDYKKDLTDRKTELKDFENNLKIAKNNFDELISQASFIKGYNKLDKDGKEIKDKKGNNISISVLEALKDQLKFANKDFEKQNKEFQKLEHRNAGLLQKASDALFGFDEKGKAKEETKKLTTELKLKGSQKIVDAKNANISLR